MRPRSTRWLSRPLLPVLLVLVATDVPAQEEGEQAVPRALPYQPPGAQPATPVPPTDEQDAIIRARPAVVPPTQVIPPGQQPAATPQIVRPAGVYTPQQQPQPTPQPQTLSLIHI